MRVKILFCFLIISNMVFAQREMRALNITRLHGDFYIYTTYNYYQGGRISANGMYLITDSGAIIFDSPWDTTQFQPLLDSIRVKHNKKAIMCIATHFHEDRTGGLEYYRAKGIRTYTTRRTDQLSAARGMKRAEHLLDQDTVFVVGDYTFQTFFPGHGHAPDNIVIWFEKQKILYGSCLVKSVEDKTLGNLGDADVREYPNTLKKVKRKFKKPRYIITGHNGWRDTGSLEHTLKMAMLEAMKN